MKDIQEKVFEIIRVHAKYDDEITMDVYLVEDMGFTSIELVEVVYDLETEFDVCMEPDELNFDKINLISNLVGLIERKVSEND